MCVCVYAGGEEEGGIGVSGSKEEISFEIRLEKQTHFYADTDRVTYIQCIKCRIVGLFMDM